MSCWVVQLPSSFAWNWNLVLLSCEYHMCRRWACFCSQHIANWVHAFIHISQTIQIISIFQKVKFPILVSECWAWSWSRCTGSQPAGGRLPLHSARRASCHLSRRPRPHLSLTNTKLYCSVSEAHSVNNLLKVVTQLCMFRWKLNLRPIDRKSKLITATTRRHHTAVLQNSIERS